MDLNDLYGDTRPGELAELGLLSVTGKISGTLGNIATLTAAVSKATQAGATPAQIARLKKSSPQAVANVAKASLAQIRRLLGITPAQASRLTKATPAQLAALARATPAKRAALAKAKPAQLAALAKATPVQRAVLVKASPAALARMASATAGQRTALARATPGALARLAAATPAQRAALAEAAPAQLEALKRLAINHTAPAAYRQLACTSGVGGPAGLAMLQHIKKLVDLANTRALATSEHNVLTNTAAFRRAVLRGLRQRIRSC